jgi:N-methylhydantoinase B
MVVETDKPAVGNTAGDGVRYGACGILGGKAGAPHHYTLHSKGRPARAIKTKEVGLEIRPRDVLVLESGGGGGWGNPAERDPAAIARDLADGFVTQAAARVALFPPRQAGEGRVGVRRPSRANMRGSGGTHAA